MGKDPRRYQDEACLLSAMVQTPHFQRQENPGSHPLLFFICHLRPWGLKKHPHALEKGRLLSERRRFVEHLLLAPQNNRREPEGIRASWGPLSERVGQR